MGFDEMKKFVQIAIDGPAAAGKSTIAKLMAEKLQYVYIDTGAMYRAITWAVLNVGININDEAAIIDLLTKTKIVLAPGGIVLVDGVDVSKVIRDKQVTAHVSQIATYRSVRDELKNRQIALANCDNVIMDGRDIGTNVLPNATFKFFMIADARVRAVRRHKENLEKGIESDLDRLEADIKNRDKIDANREHSPLKQAKDAILIDTSALSINQVVDKMIGFVLK
jgi:cytidylate kinase